jgi:hypothetical protein
MALEAMGVEGVDECYCYRHNIIFLGIEVPIRGIADVIYFTQRIHSSASLFSRLSSAACLAAFRCLCFCFGSANGDPA